MPRAAINGVRTNIILLKHQRDQLAKLADKTGVVAAEHVRRAIEQYLKAVKAQ